MAGDESVIPGPGPLSASALRRQSAHAHHTNKAGRASPSPLLCFSWRASLANSNALADEGEVVIAARGVRDRGAAVGGDAQLSAVGDGAAVDRNRAAPGVANADGVAGIAAAVDVPDCDRAAIGGSGSDATVTSRSDILHFPMPSLWPSWAPSTL